MEVDWCWENMIHWGRKKTWVAATRPNAEGGPESLQQKDDAYMVGVTTHNARRNQVQASLHR